MAKLIIIGHLDKAENLNKNKDDVALGSLFGYTFSVGWSETDRPMIGTDSGHPLLPWSWNPIGKIQLFGRGSAGAWQPIGAFPTVVPPAAATLNIRTEATRRYGNASSIQWPDPSATSAVNKLEIRHDKAGRLDPWTAQVLEMCGMPFPVAQTLNLSFAFEAKQDLRNYTAFAAAPVLAPGLVGNGELGFTAFQESSRPSDGYCVYDQGVGGHPFEIMAASNVVGSATAAIPLQISAYSADWQEAFLLAVANLFSVPAFVQFVLSPPDNTGLDPVRDDFVPILVSAGIACLRDLISPGLEAGPLGGFKAVRDMWNSKGLTPQVRNMAYDAAFPNTRAWTDFLRKNLASRDQLSVWNLVARDANSAAQLPSNPTRYYGQLKRDFATLMAQILDESRLGSPGYTDPGHQRLMVALWSALVASLTAPQDIKNSLMEAVLALPGGSYARRWLDDTFGMFWQDILDPRKAGGGANPYSARTVALSKYFLLIRLGLPVTGAETPRMLPPIWRSIPTDWMPQGTQLTAWNGLKPLLVRWIDKWHETLTAAFDPARLATTGQATSNPPPVHLQYGSFDRDVDADVNTVTPSADPFRTARGVGLLVRERGLPQWSVVNLNAAVDLNGNLCISTPVGFPIRCVFSATLRRAMTAYNSEPLAGGTALDQADGMQGVLARGPDQPAVPEPLLRAEYHDDVQAPALKYGQEFSFSTFPVLNSGILLPELRNGDQRAWRSLCTSPPAGSSTVTVLYQRTTPVGALRVTHVEPNTDQKAKVPSIPAGTYPRARDIEWALLSAPYPLGPKEPEKMNLVLLSPVGWQRSAALRNTHVLQSSYELRVRLPEVTWREWSTWGASLLSRAETGLPDPSQFFTPLDRDGFVRARAAIAAECIGSSLKNKDRSAMPAVDDPCLARLLYIELLEEGSGTLNAVGEGQLLPIPQTLKDEDAKRRWFYQAAGARVICSHNGSSASVLAPPDISGQSITASVQQGKVAVLRISACIPSEYQTEAANQFGKMFADKIVPTEALPKLRYKNRDYIRTSSYETILEAATAELPGRKELYDALQVSLRLRDSDESRLTVAAAFPRSVPGVTSTGSILFLHIGSAVALRQTWRWEGRPVPLHPVLLPPPAPPTGGAAPTFDQLEKEWIWKVYPERPDDESDLVQMPVVRRKSPVSIGGFDGLVRSGCRYFELADQTSTAVGPLQPQPDARGSHVRFSIQVTSRYDAMLKLAGLGASASRIAHPEPPADVTLDARSRAWKCAYLPSRVENPSVPKLRMLFPLTEPDIPEPGKASSSSRSFLAVFDDVFHDQVGLGDTLQAEIVAVPVPNQTSYVPNAGIDPELRDGKEEAPAVLKPYKDAMKPPLVIPLDASDPSPKWAGPIGNYRDFNNRYARFLGTSFIIPAPTQPDGTEIDARNWMAEVRFRRNVRSKNYPAANPASAAYRDFTGEDVRAWEPKSFTSRWTDGYWVQLVGSFSRFDGFGDHVSKLVPRISDDGAVALYSDKGPELLNPVKVPNFPDSRRLYAVLTRRAYDFRGRFNQEIYIATLAQDAANKRFWRARHPKRIEALQSLTADFRVRIVEIAFPTAGPNLVGLGNDPEELFRQLFTFSRVTAKDISGPPFYSPTDGVGRVVRMSAPMNSVTTAQPADACASVERIP